MHYADAKVSAAALFIVTANMKEGEIHKDGFIYQTGVGGASIASTIYLAEVMRRENIHMGLGLGGIATPMVKLLEEGLIGKLVDTQDYDLGAVESVGSNPNHIEITGSEYANPMNKGAYVNRLDFVILAALEVDTHFNCNVITDSTGLITGAQGGHPDTAAGAKCTIVITPLLQGRSPAVCADVTTVTTPGESVDVVVTEYGIAVNPLRPDLMDAAKTTRAVVRNIRTTALVAHITNAQGSGAFANCLLFFDLPAPCADPSDVVELRIAHRFERTDGAAAAAAREAVDKQRHRLVRHAQRRLGNRGQRQVDAPGDVSGRIFVRIAHIQQHRARRCRANPDALVDIGRSHEIKQAHLSYSLKSVFRRNGRSRAG